MYVFVQRVGVRSTVWKTYQSSFRRPFIGNPLGTHVREDWRGWITMADTLGGTFGSLAIRNNIPLQRFSTALLDENGQTWPVETLQAMLRSQRVLLNGDHKQLQKGVSEVKLRHSGFATSLMERMGHTLGFVMLIPDYRSHPAVVSVFPISSTTDSSKVPDLQMNLVPFRESTGQVTSE